MNSQSPVAPLEVPADAAGVLLFGGSFDPPTRAHLALADRARTALFGERGVAVLVPAARSPHKDEAPAATDADRTAMLRLAIAGRPRIIVWTDELERGGVSYWVETVRRARRVRPATLQTRFLIGADQAASFHLWREARAILSLCEPAVLLRAPLATSAALERALRETRAWSAEELARWRTWVLDVEPMESSSTAVREGARLDLLEPSVAAYVRSRGLYGARG